MTPFSTANVSDKSTITVVIDENIIKQPELVLAFRYFSAEESVFVASKDLKAFLDTHAGDYLVLDFNNLPSPSPAPAASYAKVAKVTEGLGILANLSTEKEVLIGLTVTKEENFPKWYEQILTRTEMLDY